MKPSDYKSVGYKPRLFLGILMFSVAWSSVAYVQAQEPGANPAVPGQAKDSDYKLQVQTNVVVVRAVVRDSHGRAVAGLRKEDFKISDNRKEQDISGFSVETASGQIQTGLSQPAEAMAKSPVAEAVAHPAVPRIFLALYFDDLNSVFDSVVRSRDAAEIFIAGLPLNERIGIFTSSGRDTLDFTDDRKKIHEALFKLRANSRTDPKQGCMEITDYLANQVVNKEDRNGYRILWDQAINSCHMDPRFITNEYLRMQAQAVYGMDLNQTRVDLDSLDGVLDHLALMPGERQVMLVSDGFMNLEVNDRMEHVIDHALRARVIISALDGKGLAVGAREADASRTSLPTGDIAGIYHLFDGTREAVAAATLEDIAEGTGGQFYHNSNDLLEGFRRTLAPPEVSYVLSFSPQQLKNDGSFHELKVSLANGHGMKVQARKGYFAPMKKLTPAQDAVNQIREALFSPDIIQGLPISVQTHLNRPGTVSEQVEVDTKLDIRGLPFKIERARNINNVFFVIALFDRDGKYVMGNQQEVDLALRASELADLEATGLTFHARVPVKSGEYTVRVVVREIQGGKMAASSMAVNLPL